MPRASSSTPVWFTSDCRSGDARAPGALAQLLRKRQWSDRAARAQQVHGPDVELVSSLKEEKTFPSVDGLLTQAADQPLAIFSADCVPIFLASRDGQAVGLLHAGWRGVRTQILKRGLALMKREWHITAKQVDLWMGPAIGPCCFEVRWDVARYFPSTRRRRKDRWTVDLRRELRRQAQALGVHWRKDRENASCTAHEKKYYSFRRDATNDRIVSVIMKTSPQ